MCLFVLALPAAPFVVLHDKGGLALTKGGGELLLSGEQLGQCGSGSRERGGAKPI